jgi:hypothetical protein
LTIFDENARRQILSHTNWANRFGPHPPAKLTETLLISYIGELLLIYAKAKDGERISFVSAHGSHHATERDSESDSSSKVDGDFAAGHGAGRRKNRPTPSHYWAADSREHFMKHAKSESSRLDFGQILGRNPFIYMHSNLVFPLEVISEVLSVNALKIVTPYGYVEMDEIKRDVDNIKASHFRTLTTGEHVLFIVTLTVEFESGRCVVVGMRVLFLPKDDKPKTTHWEWARRVLMGAFGPNVQKTLSQLIFSSDTFYLTNEALEWMIEKGFKFISALHPQWHQAAQQHLSRAALYPGESSGWLSSKGGLAYYHQSFRGDNRRRSYFGVTNVFTIRRDRKLEKDRTPLPALLYNHIFNLGDKANEAFHETDRDLQIHDGENGLIVDTVLRTFAITAISVVNERNGKTALPLSKCFGKLGKQLLHRAAMHEFADNSLPLTQDCTCLHCKTVLQPEARDELEAASQLERTDRQNEATRAGFKGNINDPDLPARLHKFYVEKAHNEAEMAVLNVDAEHQGQKEVEYLCEQLAGTRQTLAQLWEERGHFEATLQSAVAPPKVKDVQRQLKAAEARSTAAEARLKAVQTELDATTAKLTAPAAEELRENSPFRLSYTAVVDKVEISVPIGSTVLDVLLAFSRQKRAFEVGEEDQQAWAARHSLEVQRATDSEWEAVDSSAACRDLQGVSLRVFKGRFEPELQQHVDQEALEPSDETRTSKTKPRQAKTSKEPTPRLGREQKSEAPMRRWKKIRLCRRSQKAQSAFPHQTRALAWTKALERFAGIRGVG